MGVLPKEVVREIIKENNFQTPQEIMKFLKDSFKDILQEMLEAEMDVHLGYSKGKKPPANSHNTRNGYSSKTVRSELGPVELNIPRDRKGEYNPKIVPKYSRDVSGIEEKVISLYAKGMSTRDIHEQIKELYGVEVSAELVSKITEGIVPEIKEWQNRPLEKVYPFIFMDAIHYKVRDEGQVNKRAAYVVVGIDLEGYKDILGIWIGDNESAKFWLGVLNDLKNRGVEDVLIFCLDGLTGLEEAIEAVYPKAEVQRCIIHQLRNSFKYVSYKDLKEFTKDFKSVYTAPNDETALEMLYELKKNGRKNTLMHSAKEPKAPIHKIIYTSFLDSINYYRWYHYPQ